MFHNIVIYSVIGMQTFTELLQLKAEGFFISLLIIMEVKNEQFKHIMRGVKGKRVKEICL